MMNRKCRYVTELHMVHSILKFSDLSHSVVQDLITLSSHNINHRTLLPCWESMNNRQPSDYVPSSKEQLDSGTMPHNVICRNDLLLVDQGFDKIACVSEKTAQKFGFTVLIDTQHAGIKYPSANAKEDTNVGDGKITITSAPYQSYSVVVNPRISLEFPQNIKINETVIINYTVDWIHEDGTILYILPLAYPHGIPLVAASIDFGLIGSVSMINSEVNLIFGAVNTSFP